MQSGRPVGVMQTHEWAPRVLIANSNLVPDWATWPEFRRLEQLGLTMYGQMTAGSWIYIGTQGILQGTYETFAAVAAKRFNGTLAGTLTVTGGCGGMGGAQPLAVTMNDGVCLMIDVDQTRLQRRVDHRYLDEIADDLDDAIARCEAAKTARLGRLDRAGRQLRRPSCPSCCAAASTVDIVTDQTSAHDPLSYLPEGIDLDDWHDYAETKPEEFTDRARVSMAKHVEAMVGFLDAGAEVFDYGNSIRDEARHGRLSTGRSPSPASSRRTSGRCSARARARSAGRRCRVTRRTSRSTDQAVLDLFPDNDHLHRWIRAAQDRVAFQGLPARICWLGYGERDKAGLAVQRPGRLGRGRRRRSSSAATTSTAARSPRPTARPRRWPTARTRSPTGRCSTRWSTRRPGATWVSIHHGGGVGIGRSIHAGQVSVADGTAAGRAEARPGC